MNLRFALNATEPEWRALLQGMFDRVHFILGEQVEAFEREFAAATGAPFAVGTGSGTGALELCLRSAGVTSPRDRVLTSALTAPFTGLAIYAAGATPQFADIDPDTLLLDPGDAEDRAGRATRALMPVHLYGSPCDMKRFASLARTLRATLVQDACQAHGARFAARPLTDYSPYVAYSFYPTKNLGGVGDGGAVATGTASIASSVRLLRDGARTRRHVSLARGINSRLDEIQACFLSAFLPHLAEWNAHRAQIARWYDESLAACRAVRPVRRASESVNHLYVIRARRRAALLRFLSARGIGAGIHYPVPLHLQPAFRDCGARPGDLPHAEKAAREILSLPMWPGLTQTDIGRVAGAVCDFYR